MRPHRWQPTRLPCPWDSPCKNTGVVAISFFNAWKWKLKVKSLSRVRPLATPWSAAHQAPPSMGLSRQEYWSGVPLNILIRSLTTSWSISETSLESSLFHEEVQLETEISYLPTWNHLQGKVKMGDHWSSCSMCKLFIGPNFSCFSLSPLILKAPIFAVAASEYFLFASSLSIWSLNHLLSQLPEIMLISFFHLLHAPLLTSSLPSLFWIYLFLCTEYSIEKEGNQHIFSVFIFLKHVL